MKHHLHKLVEIPQLKAFLKGVEFPISDDELEKLAKAKGADKSVVEFLEAIDESVTYQNAADVITHAEEVNLLRQEEEAAPPEETYVDEY